jgi:predicted ATPase
VTAEGAFLRYNEAVLKSVRLKNFKLHESTSIEAAPITVFIGPNNSGKSSVFQALLILKQAASSSSSSYSLVSAHQRQETKAGQPFLYAQYDRPVVDLGDFGDILRRASQELQIGADVELAPAGDATDLVRRAGEFRISFDTYFRDNLLVRHTGSVACSFGQSTPWRWERKAPGGAQRATLGVPYGTLILAPGERVDVLVQANVEPTQAPVLPGPATELGSLRDLAGGLWKRLLDSLHPVFPLRGFEEWACPSTEFPERENLDRLVLADRAVALTNLLASNARLKTQISERLKSLVRTGMEFENTSLRRVKVWATSAESGTPETLFVNEGSGANQLPFILVPIALASAHDTILLSEPEAHLHPKGQCELTRMLLTVAKKEHIQFFIETHSEHVLHVILNAIGKRELEPSQIAIYSFENVNGTAKVTPLDVDEQGGVKGGLPGFFDQSLDELTEYLETLKKPSA